MIIRDVCVVKETEDALVGTNLTFLLFRQLQLGFVRFDQNNYTSFSFGLEHKHIISPFYRFYHENWNLTGLLFIFNNHS